MAMVHKNVRYVYPSKGNMNIMFRGKYETFGKEKVRGRPVFDIIDYKDYNLKYPGDILCMYPTDIATLKEESDDSKTA